MVWLLDYYFWGINTSYKTEKTDEKTCLPQQSLLLQVECLACCNFCYRMFYIEIYHIEYLWFTWSLVTHQNDEATIKYWQKSQLLTLSGLVSLSLQKDSCSIHRSSYLVAKEPDRMRNTSAIAAESIFLWKRHQTNWAQHLSSLYLLNDQHWYGIFKSALVISSICITWYVAYKAFFLTVLISPSDYILKLWFGCISLTTSYLHTFLLFTTSYIVRGDRYSNMIFGIWPLAHREIFSAPNLCCNLQQSK